MKKPKAARKAPNATPTSFPINVEKNKARQLVIEARKQAWERKRKLEEERNKIVVIPPRPPTEHQMLWLEKNAQPKVRTLPRFMQRRIPSRWGKRGPMSRKDWVRFFNWAARNAAAKVLPPPPKETTVVKKKKKSKQISLAEVMNHTDDLAKPKWPRQKYDPPPKPVYHYSPQIDFKNPPKHDKGRPFAPPKVPIDFQHIELEIEFWSRVRFPIRKSVFKYNPSQNIIKLAEPRVTPPYEPHCPIPPKRAEYVDPRRRMNRQQWNEHKRRLEYLAKPVYRPVIDIFY